MKTTLRLMSLILCIVFMLQAAACGGDNEKQDGTTGTGAEAVKDPTGEKFDGAAFTLLDSDITPVIYVDAGDYKQSVRAVTDLAADFKRVSDKKPEIKTEIADLEGAKVAVIIGTLGKSEFIDTLAENGTIDVSEIKDKWEAYKITPVKDLQPGIESAVIIAGSDKRGTIYGTYTLSELIGVSPWYYWGDVPAIRQDSIILPVSSLTQVDMPDVKYRGIFINDEENFTSWSARKTSSKNPGRPNPSTYETIFELLLRLKANTLWPAMHACSDAFNKYKNPETGVSYNAELANDYGIVMSASHCEMMLRDNEGEWDDWAAKNQKKYGIVKVNDNWHSSYDYTVNAKAMDAYWEERVAENYRFENIYMIGLRGVHDSGINCSKLSDTSYKGKATVVKAAVESQLKILAKYEQKYYEETGEQVKFQTAYCVYKEAAEYYKYDLSLPFDCTLVYCDDNHGYVRQVPTEEELKNYQGFGMYYHVSYWGRPCSYLWVSNTPLPLIAEEMRKSYNSGMRDLWILNVGDIKPAELKTEYFMDLGWDIDSHTENNTEEFTAGFLMQNFGLSKEKADEFALELTGFYQLMRNYVPEQMGKRDGMDYSVTENGGEGFIVLDQATDYLKKSQAVMDSISAAKIKTAYYELIHFTVLSYKLMVEKYVAQEMNRICLLQGRFAAANLYADISEAAYQAVLDEIKTYNAVNGGKWNGIMNPYNSAQPVIEGAPKVTRASAGDLKTGAAMVGEGQEIREETVTLYFGSLNNNIRFIDIFSRGGSEADWSLCAPGWVKIKDADGKDLSGIGNGDLVIYSGTVGVQKRYYISIDYEKLTKGKRSEGELKLTDDMSNVSIVKISALYSASDVTADLNSGKKGYYEETGLVSIEAEHYSTKIDQGGFSWKEIKGLGRSGSSMIALADNGFTTSKVSSDFASKAPCLEYDIFFNNTGSYLGWLYRLPTLNESSNGRLTCNIGVSVDNGSVKTLRGTIRADDSDTSAWAQMILLHADRLRFSFDITEAGWHTVRIYMSDPNICFDQIVLSNYTLDWSRLAPFETFNTVSYVAPALAAIPELSFDGLSFGEFTKKFDFAPSGVTSPADYIKLTNTDAGSASSGYIWTPGSCEGANRSTLSKLETLDAGLLIGKNNSSATLKIFAEPNAVYGISVFAGDPAGTAKSSNMRVIANGSESEIMKTGAGVYGFFIKVTSDENGLVELRFTGDWTLSYLELYPFKDVRSENTGAFIPASNGDIVIEAESALEDSDVASTLNASDNSDCKWMQIAGVSGSALFFGPNKGAGYTDADLTSTKAAKLFYTFETTRTGAYSVWALLRSSGLDDDSVFFSVDNGASVTYNNADNTNGFVWIKLGTTSSLTIGQHTLAIFGREDGIAIDQIVLRPSTVTSAEFTAAETRK